MYKPLIQQKLCFFLLDALLILAAFTLSFVLRLGGFYRTDFPFEAYFENALFTMPLWLLLLIWGGKYALQEKSFGEHLRTISLASFASAMLFVLIFFFRREVFFSRLIVFYIFLFGTVFLVASFFLEKYIRVWKVRRQKDIIRTLIIGANRAAEEIIATLLYKKSRHQPVAVLAPFGSHHKELHGIPILGKLDALERIVAQEKIQEILLCDGSEQMLNLLSFAEGKFLEFWVAPEILGIFRGNVVPAKLAGKTLLSLQPSPLFGWGQFWKRGADFVFALLALIVCSPFWLLAKLFRGRKALFQKEKRLGAAGREFQLWRFSKASNSFFRDLPNLINILHGEMSFVGPRPAVEAEWENLPPHFKRRLLIRPGLFGSWQLKKLKGAADDGEEMYKLDLQYIQNWSLWGDMKIIVQSKWQLLKNFFHFKK